MSKSMYAVIKTGGKQYRVEPGELVDVELLDADIGDTVDFDQVLFVANGEEVQIGAPYVADCIVKGELIDFVAGPKIQSMKYRKRKRSYKKWGHRQYYSRFKIQEIQLGAKGEKHHGA